MAKTGSCRAIPKQGVLKWAAPPGPGKNLSIHSQIGIFLEERLPKRKISVFISLVSKRSVRFIISLCSEELGYRFQSFAIAMDVCI